MTRNPINQNSIINVRRTESFPYNIESAENTVFCQSASPSVLKLRTRHTLDTIGSRFVSYNVPQHVRSIAAGRGFSVGSRRGRHRKVSFPPGRRSRQANRTSSFYPTDLTSKKRLPKRRRDSTTGQVSWNGKPRLIFENIAWSRLARVRPIRTRQQH